MPYPGQPITQRVQIGKSPDDCWLWLGPTTEIGHGKITFAGRDMLAHRWIWSQLFGPIPEGAVVYPTCGVVGCVNPHHLECDHYATSCRRRGATKLLPADVAEIRAAQATAKPATAGILAARYGISKQTIRDIWAGRSWARARPRKVGRKEVANG